MVPPAEVNGWILRQFICPASRLRDWARSVSRDDAALKEKEEAHK